ncbi:GNAT family N-acetyltransferase [Candidatus Bathyarchaeota archaeon]|nr:GNAT family N-acetyltransferase [Candidatus Bathyarchaeota archaeon]
MNTVNLQFYPLTKQRWNDLERLFGKRGACGGCWCMLWRLRRSEFAKQKGEGNRMALKEIVDSGEIPGILAYVNGEPIGWCAVAPREMFPTLERSQVLKRVDDKQVWSVVCFYIAKQFRHKGITVHLLRTAIEHIRKRGGKIVEGYPIEPKKGKFPDVFAYTGLASAFHKVGFLEVARRSETRPIMRYIIHE